MSDAIDFHAKASPGKLALLNLATGERISYAEANDRIAKLAGLIRERLGNASGERVVMLSRNSAFMLLVHYACARAGHIFVPLNWRLAAPEIASLIDDAKPAAIFYQPDFAAGERLRADFFVGRNGRECADRAFLYLRHVGARQRGDYHRQDSASFRTQLRHVGDGHA